MRLDANTHLARMGSRKQHVSRLQNATVRFSPAAFHAFVLGPLKAPTFANVISPLPVIVLLLLLLSTRDCAKSLVIGAGGNCVRSTCELTVRWLLEPVRSVRGRAAKGSRERAGWWWCTSTRGVILYAGSSGSASPSPGSPSSGYQTQSPSSHSQPSSPEAASFQEIGALKPGGEPYAAPPSPKTVFQFPEAGAVPPPAAGPASYTHPIAGKRPCGFTGTFTSYEEMQIQFSLDDKAVRRIFIRKVYAILLIQLLVTVAIVSLFTFSGSVRFYIQTHPGLYMASYLTFFATYIALTCCGDLRRKYPMNLVLLTIFTLSMASMMGFMSSFYNTKSVVLCLGITALVCLSVTLFSFHSKFDFTSCQGVLFALCVVMLLCAISLSIVVPFGYVPWLHAVYAVIGAILFTLFLAFDTQLLLGNKRYSMSPEEYIFATLNLYLDIVYLFSFLLQCIGGGRE
ncbi:unnamed protein product [Lota lota]